MGAQVVRPFEAVPWVYRGSADAGRKARVVVCSSGGMEKGVLVWRYGAEWHRSRGACVCVRVCVCACVCVCLSVLLHTSTE